MGAKKSTGGHLDCESTSGLQWPHNGLTMATQWPLVIYTVAAAFSTIQKTSDIEIFLKNKTGGRPLCKLQVAIVWPL